MKAGLLAPTLRTERRLVHALLAFRLAEQNDWGRLVSDDDASGEFRSGAASALRFSDCSLQGECDVATLMSMLVR